MKLDLRFLPVAKTTEEANSGEYLLTRATEEYNNTTTNILVNTPDISNIEGITISEDSKISDIIINSALDPKNGSFQIIKGYGAYQYDKNSNAVIDNETCIASTDGIGRFLLILPSLDYIDYLINGNKETAPAFFIGSNIYQYPSTSIAATGGTSTITLNVKGAIPGDIVSVIPPKEFNSNANFVGVLWNATIVENDNVVVRLINASNAARPLTGTIWTVRVYRVRG